MVLVPLAGVGVTVVRDGTLLLGKRLGSHGAGEYSTPGGHLDHLESFEACARREVREECGLEITNIRFQFVANVAKYAPRHYLHVGLLADWKSGQAEVLEPGKCEAWGWYPFDSIPAPLFEMTRLALVAFRENRTYFDLAG